jgi:hypothetical protein
MAVKDGRDSAINLGAGCVKGENHNQENILSETGQRHFFLMNGMKLCYRRTTGVDICATKYSVAQMV